MHIRAVIIRENDTEGGVVCIRFYNSRVDESNT
jgi:hypothetical protein